WTYAAHYTTTQGDIDESGGKGATLDDTASVTTTQGASGTASVSVTVDHDPALTITKTFTTTPNDSLDDSQADHAGQAIDYTIKRSEERRVGKEGGSGRETGDSGRKERGRRRQGGGGGRELEGQRGERGVAKTSAS